MKLDDLLASAERAIERPKSKSAMHYRNAVTSLEGKKLIIKLIKDWQRLRLALGNYGDMHHIMGLDDWEVPSGEAGLLCPTEHINPECCSEMVEDGSVARYALKLSDKEWPQQKS